MDILAKKADKVGFENDIVELNYTKYRDNSIEFKDAKPSNILKRISGTLNARFFPNGDGSGTELFRKDMSTDSYRDIWEQEYNAANMYLDRLVEKYPNERIGISIIEN